MSEPDDLIEHLAREAGAWADEIAPRPGRAVRFAALRRFAVLVAEECAKIADSTWEADEGASDECSGFAKYGENSARAIRAKFKEPT